MTTFDKIIQKVKEDSRYKEGVWDTQQVNEVLIKILNVIHAVRETGGKNGE